VASVQYAGCTFVKCLEPVEIQVGCDVGGCSVECLARQCVKMLLVCANEIIAYGPRTFAPGYPRESFSSPRSFVVCDGIEGHFFWYSVFGVSMEWHSHGHSHTAGMESIPYRRWSCRPWSGEFLALTPRSAAHVRESRTSSSEPSDAQRIVNFMHTAVPRSREARCLCPCGSCSEGSGGTRSKLLPCSLLVSPLAFWTQLNVE